MEDAENQDNYNKEKMTEKDSQIVVMDIVDLSSENSIKNENNNNNKNENVIKNEIDIENNNGNENKILNIEDDDEYTGFEMRVFNDLCSLYTVQQKVD